MLKTESNFQRKEEKGVRSQKNYRRVRKVREDYRQEVVNNRATY